MIGIVVVAHSRALAEAATAFALQTIPTEPRPRIEIAAGRDGGLGTDPAQISTAVLRADSGDGVLILLDLGSALLSAQLAVGFLDPPIAGRVVISPAPLVEGLLGAAVAAASGASLEECAHEASSALAPKDRALGEGNGDEPTTPIRITQTPLPRRPAAHRPLMWRTQIENVHGLHIRPSATLVTALRDVDADVQLSNATTGRGPVPASGLSRVTGLELRQGQILEARISGPQAAKARDILSDLAAQQFGDKPSRHEPRSLLDASPLVQAGEPLGTGSQIAIGPIHRRTAVPRVDGYHPGSPKEELARFNRADSDVSDYLDALAQSRPGSGILQAQSALVTDRDLAHDVVARITEGFGAVEAVSEYLTKQARTIDQLTDPYLRERAQDVRSVRRLLILALLGRPLTDEEPDTPCIWLVDELDAAMAARLDTRLCLGVITQFGSRNGHGALTAEARGIPVLCGREDVADLREGQIVAFDPLTAQLWIDPTEDRLADLKSRDSERTALRASASALAHDPALTTDGVRVRVEANVSSISDARVAAKEGADGSGIVRTEILFAARRNAPTAQEQCDLYTMLGRTLHGGQVTIRTWDAGGDKPLPFFPVPPEANPALGERGIRAMRRDRDAFIEQLRGIALAARETPMRVMFPMVTHPAEVEWARGLLDEVIREVGGDVELPVGIMVEVPAVALRAKDFLGLVDFVSLGTNDLAQYVLASDRTNARVVMPSEDPALWDLIEYTCDQVRGHIPIAVCGNLASEPTATPRLLQMGVTELSVRPTLVGQVKQAVRIA